MAKLTFKKWPSVSVLLPKQSTNIFPFRERFPPHELWFLRPLGVSGLLQTWRKCPFLPCKLLKKFYPFFLLQTSLSMSEHCYLGLLDMRREQIFHTKFEESRITKYDTKQRNIAIANMKPPLGDILYFQSKHSFLYKYKIIKPKYNHGTKLKSHNM